MHEFEGKKILLAEDEAELLELWRDELESQGAEVLTCTNGEEAWEAAQREEFDLILSDIRMPKMTGIQLLEKVRAKSPDTLIVLISGFVYDGFIAENSNCAAPNLFLPKPVNPAKLLGALRELFNPKRAA